MLIPAAWGTRLALFAALQRPGTVPKHSKRSIPPTLARARTKLIGNLIPRGCGWLDGNGCQRGGVVRCLYGEAIDLGLLGPLSISRASRVEPDGGSWWADLAPVGGPKPGPLSKRSQALAAEEEWLVAFRLVVGS